MFDSIIIGGSSAGLSAALTLARALKKVIVFDDGKPCNRFSHASHGFLTQDGVAPSEIIRQARQQLEPYKSVEIKQARVVSVTTIVGGFEVVTSEGETFQCRKLLLATGVRDELPALEGIDAFWGKSVFHCPYCDGYELRGQPMVVYGRDESVLHQAMFVSNLTDKLTVCTDGAFTVSPEKREIFAREGIKIVESFVSGLRGTGHQIEAIMFTDGSEIPCDAMFIRPTSHHSTTLAHDLGCQLDESGLVKIDLLGRTSTAGVYVAGDLSNARRNIAIAVAQGSSAGHAINLDLTMERFSY